MPTLFAEAATSERRVEAAVVLYRDWLGASPRVLLGRAISPSVHHPWAELYSTQRLSFSILRLQAQRGWIGHNIER